VDVFLIPLRPPSASGTPEFVLYCEPAPEPIEPEVEGAPRRGFFARMVTKFKQAMAEGEEEERRQEAGFPESQAGSRAGRFMKRKLASAVAEHRLLWTLRHHTQATLHYPSSVAPDRAIGWAVDEFRRDFSKHRLWCVLHALIVVASTPLAFVPGPNFLAYYFIFLSVGHYFSMRGAQRGLQRDMWTTAGSPALQTLGDAWGLPEQEREAHVAAAARDLGLERLQAFLRRVRPADAGRS
jgi:Mitochondrial K+-H+ exchange-related